MLSRLKEAIQVQPLGFLFFMLLSSFRKFNNITLLFLPLQKLTKSKTMIVQFLLQLNPVLQSLQWSRIGSDRKPKLSELHAQAGKLKVNSAKEIHNYTYATEVKLFSFVLIISGRYFDLLVRVWGLCGYRLELEYASIF